MKTQHQAYDDVGAGFKLLWYQSQFVMGFTIGGAVPSKVPI